METDLEHNTAQLPISVLLVDDHELMRQGAKQSLQRDPAFRVVGEAAEGDEAIRMIQELKPDVVVLDIRLKDGDKSGVDIVRVLKKISPSTKALIFSAFDDEMYVKPLIKLGVRGYLVKTASTKEFKRAVLDVAQGNLVFPREIAGAVLGVIQTDKSGPPATPHLTRRETEVLHHMGDGLTNKEIAETLEISLKTVEAHVQNLLNKLGVSSRTQAVVTAMKGEMLF